ncbi:hypothetical protein DFH09DRAFT_1185452 [Mycena vulgaris]|nr:hypothetical protein DFH09DRAFT_1185452 [Mycena vulgaris]
MSSLLDRLISGTSSRRDPDIRAWHRKIVKLLEDKAPSLIQSFTYWLRCTKKAYLFALFGTVVEISPKMLNVMENSSATRAAFDERLHALVTEEYISDSSGHSPRLDLIFHGAGCIAITFHSEMSWSQSLPRFRACFLSGAEQRYEDICRLLSMTSRADREIQDGTLHDLDRLALFGSDLHRILGGESEPLSPLITNIIEKMPELPNGWMAFDSYFLAADRCSNPLQHSLSGGNAPPKDSFTLSVKSKMKRGEKLLACANCKASHFCSRMCQKEAWKGGKIPHRVVCPILAEIWKVHHVKGRKLDREAFGMLYSDAGISTEEVGRAIKYVIHLLESFSEYVD